MKNFEVTRLSWLFGWLKMPYIRDTGKKEGKVIMEAGIRVKYSQRNC